MDPLVRLLVHGAATDSYHDFGDKKNSKNEKIFNTTRDPSNPGLYHVISGIPYAFDIPKGKVSNTSVSRDRDILHNEDELLREMFTNFTNMGDFLADLRRLCEPPRPCGEKTLDIETLTGKVRYTIKLLNKNGEANVQKIHNRLTDVDFFDFFRGNNNINLLFDAGVIDIISLLQGAHVGKQPTLINVKRVINRELINDPAPKTYKNEGTKKYAEANMKFDLAFDVEKADVTYTKFTNIEPTQFQRDKFFSLLDFRLSKLMPSPNLPQIVSEIFQDGGKRVYTSNDPHKNNSITNCLQRILNLFRTPPRNHIEASMNFQLKRSGDWLQALSCLDTKRYYSDVIGGVGRPLDGNKIILVTHDRILLWYALMLGIDVLFTYMVGAINDEEEGGEEKNIDIPSGSERFLIYFSNDKLSLSKEQIEKKTMDEALTLLAIQNDVLRDIDLYNQAVISIKERRIAKIDGYFREIVERAKKDSITRLIQEYMRFTSLDYHLIEKNEIEQLGAIFSGSRTNDNAMAYASIMNNNQNKFLSLKLRPNDSLEQRIGKLEISNTAYKSDPLFQKTPVLYTEERSSTRNDIKTEIKALAGWLRDRLPKVDMFMFKKLNDSLDPIFRSFAVPGKIYFMSTFMAHMAMEILKEDPDVEIVQDHVDIIKSDVISSAEITISRTSMSGTKRRADPLDAYADKPIADASAAALAETLAQEDALQPAGTMGRNIATIPPDDDDDDDIVITGFKRKKWTTVSSFGNAIRKMASRVAAAAGGGGGAARGGGDREYYMYYLCLANIYQVFNDYMTFESDENFDYGYYEAYVKVVLASMRACTQNGQRNYKALVNLLFIEFPNGRWGPDIFPNERFQDCVTIVANNNAAQCLGLISGDFSYLQSSIDLPSILPMLAKIRSMVKGKSFDTRSQWLVLQLANEFQVEYRPMYQMSSPMSIRTGRPITNISSVNTMNMRELTSVYGGKRTRKARKNIKRRHRTRKQL